jgi:hypothetical protein
MDFNIPNLGMDMDFNPSMSVDPSTLQFDPNTTKLGGYDYDNYYPQTTDFLPPGQPFPFTFQPNGTYLSTGDLGQYHQRRSSITSSSSSSGASLSPILEHSMAAPGHHQMAQQSSEEQYPIDPADELAQRVRQSAGIMHAVQMGTQMSNHPQTLLTLLGEFQRLLITFYL